MHTAGLSFADDYSSGCAGGYARLGPRVVKAPALPEHAWAIAENLRDSPDVERISFTDMQLALERSMTAQSWLLDGKLVCVWGIVPTTLTSLAGLVWMVTTKEADECPLIFARHSKMELDRIMQKYTMLHGVVKPSYARSIRWLRWLGFEILPSERMHGERVYPFVRRQK